MNELHALHADCTSNKSMAHPEPFAPRITELCSVMYSFSCASLVPPLTLGVRQTAFSYYSVCPQVRTQEGTVMPDWISADGRAVHSCRQRSRLVELLRGKFSVSR